MNLQELTQGTPATKTWLAPVFGSVQCATLDVLDGLTAFGGSPAEVLQVSQTSTETITATTDELSLVSNDFVGSYSVAADSLSIGDTIRVELKGIITNAPADSLTIRLYDGLSVIATHAIAVVAAATAKSFNAVFDCTVRQIGAAGVAELSIEASYQQNVDGSNVPEASGSHTLDTAVFDTTQTTDLRITGEFSTLTSTVDVHSVKIYRS